MADAIGEPVASTPPDHGGIRATLKRIKPGEWALIGLGVASLVLFFIWYQRNQASTTSGVAGAATGTNPNWSGATTGDANTFDGEIADLLSQIASGTFTTPGTSPTGVSSAGGSGSSSSGGSSGGASAGTVSQGGVAGSAQSTGNAPDTTGTVGTIDSQASSGSGISQQGNNSSPVASMASLVLGPTGLAEKTGTVGVPLASLPGTPAKSSTVKVPAGVAPGVQSGGQAHTVAAPQGHTISGAPVNVVTSLGPVSQHAASAAPTRSVPQPKAPTKAPAGVRASSAK